MENENGTPMPPRRVAGEPVPMRMATDANLPPHPLDKRWYAHVDGQTYGPFSGHDMKKMAENSQIHENDFVCPEGGNAWSAAKADPILGTIFRKQQQATTQFHAPPPVNAQGGTVVQVTNQMPNNNAATAALLLASGDAAPKSPGVALLISFFICGGGQMYNGQVGKGIAMLIGFALTIWIGVGLIIYIWSLVDAYTTAKAMNLKYQQRVLAGLM